MTTPRDLIKKALRFAEYDIVPIEARDAAGPPPVISPQEKAQVKLIKRESILIYGVAYGKRWRTASAVK